MGKKKKKVGGLTFPDRKSKGGEVMGDCELFFNGYGISVGPDKKSLGDGHDDCTTLWR